MKSKKQTAIHIESISYSKYTVEKNRTTVLLEFRGYMAVCGGPDSIKDLRNLVVRALNVCGKVSRISEAEDSIIVTLLQKFTHCLGFSLFPMG